MKRIYIIGSGISVLLLGIFLYLYVSYHFNINELRKFSKNALYDVFILDYFDTHGSFPDKLSDLDLLYKNTANDTSDISSKLGFYKDPFSAKDSLLIYIPRRTHNPGVNNGFILLSRGPDRKIDNFPDSGDYLISSLSKLKLYNPNNVNDEGRLARSEYKMNYYSFMEFFSNKDIYIVSYNIIGYYKEQVSIRLDEIRSNDELIARILQRNYIPNEKLKPDDRIVHQVLPVFVPLREENIIKISALKYHIIVGDFTFVCDFIADSGRLRELGSNNLIIGYLESINFQEKRVYYKDCIFSTIDRFLTPQN